MNKITEERKNHIKEVFDIDAKIAISDIMLKIDKLEHKYRCIKRDKIVNYLVKRLK